ncbi:hypothetical protein [Glycomyces dulcitolivorans]|uniref:hypothetical protein n=1 Tax=Glycomyces dulcitolivorans TaxID=2200759 RepID=UPI001300B931|nr:hypothetical protein [Glycomyces dulcitolivorans]
MRTSVIAAGAALVAAVSVPWSAAAQQPVEEAEPLPPAPAQVVLPTGETVGVEADGILDFKEPDTSYTVVRGADGDRFTVPAQALGEVASGAMSLGGFNVDDPGEEPEEPAEEGTAVTVTGKWLDGSAPYVMGVSVVNLETGQASPPTFFDGGSGVGEFPQGDYHLVAVMHSDYSEGQDYELAFMIEELEVGDEPTAIEFDATGAEPVGFDLDREVVAESVIVEAFSYAPGTDRGAWTGLTAHPGGQVWAVPTDGLSGDRDTGISVRAGFSSPEGAPEPYGYNLFRIETDGIPCDMVETVHDRDLARVDTEFQSLGTPTTLIRMDMAVHPVYEPFAFTSHGTVPVPSTRTEFFTASEDLYWEQRGVFPFERPARISDWVYRDAGVLEPGQATTAVWNDAAVSVGLENHGQDYPPAMFYRWDATEAVFFSPWMFSTSSGDEAVQTEYLPGEIAIANNGIQVAASDRIGTIVDPAALAPGRLTVTAAAERSVPWTTLGTRSAAAWDFAYDPAANPALPVSVVEFTPAGIENGAVEAGTVQDFALEFVQQPGADDQDCAAMTFEISFDDGATWTEVPIDRTGDTAAAAVELPESPGFASVRFTAADEAGNTVVHETIRSYALR